MLPAAVPTPTHNPLSALPHVVRGLSALFWALPIDLLSTARTALSETWSPAGPLPCILAALLIVYGLHHLAQLHPQERIWQAALERASILGWLNVALSPTAYWFSRRPDEPFFRSGLTLQTVAGLALLLALNHVLRRLVALIPDETLRIETRLFTRFNVGILALIAAAMASLTFLQTSSTTASIAPRVTALALNIEPWQLILPALLPISLTMTMLWKAKEAVFAGIAPPAGS